MLGWPASSSAVLFHIIKHIVTFRFDKLNRVVRTVQWMQLSLLGQEFPSQRVIYEQISHLLESKLSWCVLRYEMNVIYTLKKLCINILYNEDSYKCFVFLYTLPNNTGCESFVYIDEILPEGSTCLFLR